MENFVVAHHKGRMSNETYPYSLDIVPAERPAGHFHWAIRRHGKLIERSDRPLPSEEAARKKGEAGIERQFANAHRDR